MVFFLVAIATVPLLANAQTITNQQGDWTYATQTRLAAISSSNDLNTVEYIFPLNQSYFSLSLNFTQFTANQPQWWQLITNTHNDEYFYMRIGAEDNTGAVTWLGAFEIDAWQSALGFWKGKTGYYYPNSTDQSAGGSYNIGYDTSNFTVNFGLTQSGDEVQTLGSTYSENYGSIGAIEMLATGYPIYAQNFTLTNPDLTSIVVYFGNKGYGSFTASIQSSDSTGLGTLSGAGTYGLGNSPGVSNSGILGDLYGFFTMVWGIIDTSVTFLVSMIGAFWPIFPTLLIVYLIDLFYSAYENGGVSAIGDQFYKLYNILVETTFTVVKAIETVANAVTGGIKWILALFGILL